MASDGALVAEVAADGVTEHKAAVCFDAYAMERVTQPVVKVAARIGQDFKKHITGIWLKYHQPYSGQCASGLHRYFELCQCDGLR